MRQELAMLRAAMAAWVRQQTGENRADHLMRLAVVAVVLLFPACCLLVCVGFAVFGVSETMLVHSVTLGWYVIMTAVFMVTAEETGRRGA
jgi:hypothetical protein